MGKSYRHTCLSGRHKNGIRRESSRTYEKLSRLETLLPGVRKAFSSKVSGNVADEVIGQAQEILALKREIILANPLLDMDKVIVARYRLGDKARKAMARLWALRRPTTTRYFPIRVQATMRDRLAHRSAWTNRKRPYIQARSRCSPVGHTTPLGCRPTPFLLARRKTEMADLRNKNGRKRSPPEDHRR